jgi:hypothetical protein
MNIKWKDIYRGYCIGLLANLSEECMHVYGVIFDERLKMMMPRALEHNNNLGYIKLKGT